MNNSHAPASILLLAASLAAGCSALRPANYRDLVKESTANRDLLEAASKSERNITVTIDAGRNVFFRKEKVGTVENFGPLKERVRQAIEKNEQADPRKELSGRNVVFICAPEEFKYGDVVGVIDAVRDAGGNPVGLQGCDPSAASSSP